MHQDYIYLDAHRVDVDHRRNEAWVLKATPLFRVFKKLTNPARPNAYYTQSLGSKCKSYSIHVFPNKLLS
jgi:hypothetical protein